MVRRQALTTYAYWNIGLWNSPPQPQPDRPVLDLPTPEGWKAELDLVVGYMPRWFTCLIATQLGVAEASTSI